MSTHVRGAPYEVLARRADLDRALHLRAIVSRGRYWETLRAAFGAPPPRFDGARLPAQIFVVPLAGFFPGDGALTTIYGGRSRPTSSTPTHPRAGARRRARAVPQQPPADVHRPDARRPRAGPARYLPWLRSTQELIVDEARLQLAHAACIVEERAGEEPPECATPPGRRNPGGRLRTEVEIHLYTGPPGTQEAPRCSRERVRAERRGRRGPVCSRRPTGPAGPPPV